MPIGAALRAAPPDAGPLARARSPRPRGFASRHLTAIEAGQIDQLPSRPFTIGYVRAYAKALGLDADAIAARFRTEFPRPDDDAARAGRRAARASAAAASCGWRSSASPAWRSSAGTSRVHVMARPAPQAACRASAHALALAHANSVQAGPFTVDAPLPAPPEATAPAPYVTPVANTAVGPAVVASPPRPASRRRPFVAQGADLWRRRRRLAADHPGQASRSRSRSAAPAASSTSPASSPPARPTACRRCRA